MQRGYKGGQLLSITTVNNAINIINRLQNYNVLINSDIFNEDKGKTTPKVMFSGYIPGNMQISLLKIQVDKKTSSEFGNQYPAIEAVYDTVPGNLTSLFINKTESYQEFDFTDKDENYTLLVQKSTYTFNSSVGKDVFIFASIGANGVYQTGEKFTQFLAVIHKAAALANLDFINGKKFYSANWNNLVNYFQSIWLKYSKSLNLFYAPVNVATAGISDIKAMTNSYLIRNKKQFSKEDLSTIEIFYGNDSGSLTDGLGDVYIESNNNENGYDYDGVLGTISTYTGNTRFQLKKLTKITTKIYNYRYKTGRFTNKYSGNAAVPPKDRMYHININLSDGKFFHTKQDGEAISGYDIVALSEKINGYLSFMFTGFVKRSNRSNGITDEHIQTSALLKNRTYDYLIVPYTITDQSENNVFFNYELFLNDTVKMQFAIKKNNDSLLKIL